MTKIKENVSKLLAIYNNLRQGKSINYKFWDLVVLTALNQSQKRAYELQIEEKLHEKNLPSNVKYVVIADPEGSRIGCGGATINAVYQLHAMYGEDLFKKCILLINTGGLSKRIPSCSVLGKIFMALPLYIDSLWTLLDLKLALYLPFIQKMSPGIFQTSSDTMELFDLEWECVQEGSDWDFYHAGMTALAHPSSLQIACGHGVFVVDKVKSNHKATVEFLKCLEVLQKPSLEQLEVKKAVLERKSDDGGTESFVYTDSSYFFDHQITKAFIKFFKNHQPLRCEINGYEDFMKAMINPQQFIQDSTDNPSVSEILFETRQDLTEVLKNYNLNVLALNTSEFFHLGTMQEYLDHLNPQGHLSDFIKLGNKVITPIPHPLQIHKTSVSIVNNLNMCPVIHERVVMEFCRFICPTNFSKNCILSNCNVKGVGPINIPPNAFIHTVSIKTTNKENSNEATKYVTLIFNIHDDLKKTYKSMEDFYNNQRNSFLNSINSQCQDIVFHNGVYSLWNARLFACMDSMSESFLESLKMATTENYNNNNENNNNNHHNNSRKLSFDKNLNYLSAIEVMSMPDIDDILLYRKSLKEELIRKTEI